MMLVVVLVLLLLPCGGFVERFLLPLGALMSMSSIPFKTLAREYFKLAGKKYKYEPEEEDPHEADYFLKGSAQELAAVKALVDELTQKYGDACNEFGLYIPMNILMKSLVGSRYYDGNLLTMNTDDPECIVLHAEANTMEPLLYALRQAFPNLEIEMKETKLR